MSEGPIIPDGMLTEIALRAGATIRLLDDFLDCKSGRGFPAETRLSRVDDSFYSVLGAPGFDDTVTVIDLLEEECGFVVEDSDREITRYMPRPLS